MKKKHKQIRQERKQEHDDKVLQLTSEYWKDRRTMLERHQAEAIVLLEKQSSDSIQLAKKQLEDLKQVFLLFYSI